ncbi:MAG: DNA-binding protein [Desulfovibrio sp.]|jgi:predicted DNA-binding protein with PD1-like motif|nr:DNA-binding protein [Desulfovibrio sp.]
MESKRFGNRILIRLNPGDEVVGSVMAACREHDVRLGSISGIGAVDQAVIGLFRTNTKEYVKSELRREFEITALTGNVTTMNGELYLHLHATLADEEHRAFGGHLNEAHVSATAEIVVDVLDGEVDRYFDEKIGLNLIRF